MDEEKDSNTHSLLSHIPPEIVQEGVMVRLPVPSVISIRLSETMMARQLNDESFLKTRGRSLFDIQFDGIPPEYAMMYRVNPSALDVFGIDSSASSFQRYYGGWRTYQLLVLFQYAWDCLSRAVCTSRDGYLDLPEDILPKDEKLHYAKEVMENNHGIIVLPDGTLQIVNLRKAFGNYKRALAVAEMPTPGSFVHHIVNRHMRIIPITINPLQG